MADTLLQYMKDPRGSEGPSRGDVLTVDSATKWNRLTLGTTGKVLRSDGTDALWSALVAGDIPDLSATYLALAGGTMTGTIVTSSQGAVSIQPFNTGGGQTGEIRWLELLANGTNYVGFKAPDTLAANIIWTLPVADGSAGQFLKTDGSKGLAWAAGGGSTNILLDGGNHTDTVSGPVTRGSLVYGNATPKWAELVIGTAGFYLKSDGTDAAWAALTYKWSADKFPSDFLLSATGAPTYVKVIDGTNFAYEEVQFPDAATTTAFLTVSTPPWFSGANLTVTLFFTCSGAAGNARFTVSPKSNPADGTAALDQALGTALTVDQAVPGTIGFLGKAQVTVTSMAAGVNHLVLELGREGGHVNDTANGLTIAITQVSLAEV